jgi:hypothetical protein
MAERPERAHREKLLCAATAAAATTAAATATAAAAAATPGSTTSANGMRSLAVRSPHFLSLSLSLRHEFSAGEGIPDVHTTQTYVAVIDTD